MSDTSGDASAQLINAMGGGGDSGVVPEGAPAPVSEVDISKLSPFSQNFLAGIPEADRPVVARHMPGWDSGFTQHSQRLNAQLQPYQQLGSAEEIRTIKEAFEQLKADPSGFVQQLIDMGHLTGYAPVPTQLPQQNPPGYDPAGQQQQMTPQQMNLRAAPEIQRLERAYGALAQNFQQEQQARAIAVEEQKIEQALGEAEAKYGKFDRTYVLTMMNHGLNADAAVQAWNNAVQQAVATQRPAPRVVSSTSAPPVAPGSLKTPEDRSAALVAALNQLQ